MDTTASRFGIALAVSSLVIGLVGFVVYADHPETPIKPALIHRHASVFELSATAAANDARFDQARAVLAKFVAALSNNDDENVRTMFPTITRRETRTLESLRSRLGRDARLSITEEALTSASADQIDIDFVIVAREPNDKSERRLPFHATVRDRQGSWVIETLY